MGGRWSDLESPLHINTLELLAAKLVLTTLAKDSQDCHIQLMLDNTTAISYLKRMGGTHSPHINKVAKDIWLWARERGIWLSAAHVPGRENRIADYKSRHFKDNIEWTLNAEVFQSITGTYFLPTIDLFSSRLNNHVPRFVSWNPEPEAWAVDAFTLSWTELEFYAFPPFSLIGTVLTKIQQEEAEGILVVPFWTSQPWFPLLLTLLVDHPRLIAPHQRLLTLPGFPEMDHPLHRTLNLLAVSLSGIPSHRTPYLMPLSTSLQAPGGEELWGNTIQQSEVGEHFVVQGKLIPLLLL